MISPVERSVCASPLHPTAAAGLLALSPRLAQQQAVELNKEMRDVEEEAHCTFLRFAHFLLHDVGRAKHFLPKTHSTPTVSDLGLEAGLACYGL